MRVSALVVRQLHDRRLAIGGWLAGWLVLVAMYVATWPTVHQHGKQYDAILQGLPTAIRSAIGAQSRGAFSTPSGYLTAELLGITGPLLVMTMGILLGVAALAKDEEDGTIEILLAQPVSRRTLVVSRVAAGCLELMGVLLIAGTALFAVGTAVGLGLGLAACARALGMLGLLGVEAMCLAVLVGAVTGRTGRSRAVAGAAGLLAFLLNALGPSISGLSRLVGVSPFHTLVQSDPFRRLPPLGGVGALVVPSAIFVAAAVIAFTRRDLHLH